MQKYYKLPYNTSLMGLNANRRLKLYLVDKIGYVKQSTKEMWSIIIVKFPG